jgi:hypothetical protein
MKECEWQQHNEKGQQNEETTKRYGRRGNTAMKELKSRSKESVTEL